MIRRAIADRLDLLADWRWAPALVFAVALTIRIAVSPFGSALTAGSVPCDYGNYYEPVARLILSGAGLMPCYREGVPATHFPPGYPLILAGVHWVSAQTGLGALTWVSVLNTFAFAGSAVLVFLLGSCLYDRRIGLVGALLWAKYPPVIWLTFQPHTEVPFLVCLFLGLWLFARGLTTGRAAWMAAAGAAFSAGALIRTAGLLLLPCLAVFLLVQRRRPWRARGVLAAALLAAGIAVLLPWELYVCCRTRRIVPLATGGPAAIAQGLTFGLIPEAMDRPGDVPLDVWILMKEFHRRDLDESSPGVLAAAVIEEAREAPGPFCKMLGLKVVRSWYGTLMMRKEMVLLAMQAVYLAAAVAGAVIALRTRRWSRAHAALLFTVVGYFWVLTCLVVPLLRYMVPAMGLVMILCAVTIDRLCGRRPPDARALG